MRNNDKKKDSTSEQIATSPSAQQREAAKKRILETVSGWLEARIDEVFEMADESVGEIAWNNMPEVREQICGCLADDLHHQLGEYVELILEEKFERAIGYRM